MPNSGCGGSSSPAILVLQADSKRRSAWYLLPAWGLPGRQAHIWLSSQPRRPVYLLVPSALRTAVRNRREGSKAQAGEKHRYSRTFTGLSTHKEPRPRDHTDAVKDIARDLAEVASQISFLKGDANAYLHDPDYDALRLRLKMAHAAVEAAMVEARRRVRMNEGR